MFKALKTLRAPPVSPSLPLTPSLLFYVGNTLRVNHERMPNPRYLRAHRGAGAMHTRRLNRRAGRMRGMRWHRGRQWWSPSVGRRRFRCKILRFLHIPENPHGATREKHTLLDVAQPHTLLKAVVETNSSWFVRKAAFGAAPEPTGRTARTVPELPRRPWPALPEIAHPSFRLSVFPTRTVAPLFSAVFAAGGGHVAELPGTPSRTSCNRCSRSPSRCLSVPTESGESLVARH